MYGFTHIVCLSFADGFIGLLLCILYFFCSTSIRGRDVGSNPTDGKGADRFPTRGG